MYAYLTLVIKIGSGEIIDHYYCRCIIRDAYSEKLDGTYMRNLAMQLIDNVLRCVPYMYEDLVTVGLLKETKLASHKIICCNQALITQEILQRLRGWLLWLWGWLQLAG